MRLSNLIAAGLLCCVSLFRSTAEAQITITFEGSLNGSTVALDSIYVENLTASGDTTIYYPDNQLLLDGDITVGLEGGVRSADILRSMPNPFNGNTEIVVVSTGGDMLLTVHDAMGRRTAQQRMDAVPGQHRFRYSSGMPGVHFLSVQQRGVHRTHRMVAMEGAVEQGGKLSYIGLSGSHGSFKDSRVLFTWQPGNELRYIGYATNNGNVLAAVIEDVPTVSVTHTFVFDAATPCAPAVADTDGNVYPVVAIGSQCWTAENLRTTRYRDGSTIPNVINSSVWGELSTGAWCNYLNAPINDAIYGKLYNWYAVDDARGLCPLGWHVPSDGEWSTMEMSLGMPLEDANSSGTRGEAENVGGKLKTWGTIEAGTGLWSIPNLGATNESGFSGIPGGLRGFNQINGSGFWWSATENALFPDVAMCRNLLTNNTGSGRGPNSKGTGLSVRCVRDQLNECNVPPTGTGYIDNCGTCVGGTTGLTPCTNCAGVWGTPAPGTPCDDGDPDTINDVYGNDCICAGHIVCPVTVSDIDGNVYPVVRIGNQCWMAENLKTTRYRNGASIPNVTDQTDWGQLNSGAWANYGNNFNNDVIYGKLYNWYAVLDVRGLCPQGWHVATDDEWKTLEAALGMPAAQLNNTGIRGDLLSLGGQMKTTGTIQDGTGLWAGNNTGATNESGFSGLPGGWRTTSQFAFLSFMGYWWSASENSATQQAWYRGLNADDGGIERNLKDKRVGYCVRCLRD